MRFAGRGIFSAHCGLRAPLWAAALAVGLLAHTAGWAGEPSNPARILPDSTVAFFQVRAWGDWSEAWEQTSLAKILAEPEVRTFCAGPMERLREVLGQKTPEDAPPDAAPEISTLRAICKAMGDTVPGPAILALCYSQEDAEAKRLPAVALILGIHEVNPRIQGAIQFGVSFCAERIVPQNLKQEQYQNADLTIVTTGGVSVAFTLYQKQLIVASSADVCKQIIDGLSGNALKPLAAQETYKACGLAGTEQLSVYVDMAGLARAKEAGRAAPSGRLGEILAMAGLEEIQAVACSLGMNGAAFESRTTVLAPRERQGILSALAAEPLSLDAFKVCKAGAPVAVGLRLRGENLAAIRFNLLRAIVGQGNAAHLRAVAEQWGRQGRDLKLEMDQAFGDEIVVTSYADVEEDLVTLPSMLTAWVRSLSVTDEAKADALMQDLLKQVAQRSRPGGRPEDLIHEQAHMGSTIRYLASARGFAGLIQPCYAFANGRLVFALRVSTLKKAIQNLKGQGLVETDVFQAALNGVEGRMGSMMLYADWGQFYSAVYNLGSTALTFLDPTGLLSQVGIDVYRLPPPEAIGKHLFPGLVVARVSEQGVSLVSRGPLPSAEVFAPPAAAFVGVATNIGARLFGETPPPPPPPAAQGQPDENAAAQSRSEKEDAKKKAKREEKEKKARDKKKADKQDD